MKHASFIEEAQFIARRSKDPSTKVGAIALDDDCNILATGWNGFPRGVEDTEERLCDRPTKLALTTHAEQNLIAAAARTGRRLEGATLVVSSLFPCSSCAGMIAQAGIKRVIAPAPSGDSKWYESNQYAKTIFDEAGVEVITL